MDDVWFKKAFKHLFMNHGVYNDTLEGMGGDGGYLDQGGSRRQMLRKMILNEK